MKLEYFFSMFKKINFNRLVLNGLNKYLTNKFSLTVFIAYDFQPILSFFQLTHSSNLCG